MSLSFLLSSERSGSNFIVNSVGMYSNICGPATKHLISPIARNEFRFHSLDNVSNWNQLLCFINDLLESGFSQWRYVPRYSDLQNLAPVGDYRGLIEGIFMGEAQRHGKSSCFVKENLTYEFYLFLERLFPEAKYVYQVRDPRDMALSWKNHKGHRGGVVCAAKQWQWDQQNFLFLEHHLKMTRPGSIERIRYEDLVSNYHEKLSAICTHLGSETDFQRVSHDQELLFSNSKNVDAWRNLSRPVMKHNYKKYQTELTDYEVKLIEKICFREMQFLGYDLENSVSDFSEISDTDIQRIMDSEKITFPSQWSDAALTQRLIKKKFYSNFPFKN